MCKKQSVFFIIFFLLTSIMLTGNNKIIKPYEDKLIIGINSIEYQKYLKSNSSLDRLYRKNDIFYFIINKKKYKNLRNLGIQLIHKSPLPV